MNLDEYESISSVYVNAENLTYFDSFGVENVPNSLEIKKL